jgi:hypothetical protein
MMLDLLLRANVAVRRATCVAGLVKLSMFVIRCGWRSVQFVDGQLKALYVLSEAMARSIAIRGEFQAPFLRFFELRSTLVITVDVFRVIWRPENFPSL